MFLLDWLTSLLRLLGLSSKKARIVILGVPLHTALGLLVSRTLPRSCRARSPGARVHELKCAQISDCRRTAFTGRWRPVPA